MSKSSHADEEYLAAKNLHLSTSFVVISWVLVAVWACFIFFMSMHTGSDLKEGSGIVSFVYQSLKNLQTQILGPDSDLMSSVAHFCEYTIFGVLLTNALRCHVPLWWALTVLAILFASFYGVTDEFHQLFVAGRVCDPVDWIVDTCGATLGAALTALFLHHRLKRAYS